MTDRLEASGSASVFLTGAGIKWNLVRSRFFDAAASPRAQYYFVIQPTGNRLLTLELPAPLALNLGPWASLVVTPSVLWGAGWLGADDADQAAPAPAPSKKTAWVGGLTLGLEGHDKRLAFHPAVTAYRALDSSKLYWQAGVGVHFGSLPGY